MCRESQFFSNDYVSTKIILFHHKSITNPTFSSCLKYGNTFFSPIANGSEITASDLQKVADILGGSFKGMEIVNQEYRFKFEMGI